MIVFDAFKIVKTTVRVSLWALASPFTYIPLATAFLYVFINILTDYFVRLNNMIVEQFQELPYREFAQWFVSSDGSSITQAVGYAIGVDWLIAVFSVIPNILTVLLFSLITAIYGICVWLLIFAFRKAIFKAINDVSS